MKFFFIAAWAIVLSGCSLFSNPKTWIPLPGADEYAKTFEDRLRESGAQGMPTPAEFKSVLVELIAEYHSLAVQKRRLEWDSAGMATYGGLAAVLGALADKTALLNTGAVVAGVGLTTSTTFSFGQQTASYLDAVRRFSCISSKVAAVPDVVFEEARHSDDPHAKGVAEGAMRQLISHVEGVRIEAVNSLMALAPTPLSRDELLGLLQRYQGEQKVRAPPENELKARGRAAGERIIELLTEVAICSRA